MPYVFKRVSIFTFALFVMALGVSLSVKADLGVSPISCVPYVYSFTTPLTLGELTILLNIFFIIAQIFILRKNYKIAQLSQLPAIIVFGYCIDFTMFLIADLTPSSYIEQLFWCLFACVVLAFGIFLLLKTRLTYLPVDGLAVTIAQAYKKEFGKVKISLDSSMVTFGLLSSFMLLGRLEGIREGSVIAALLIGALIKLYNSKLTVIEKWLSQESSQIPSEQKRSTYPLIITISREYGSGGHEIGKYIADELKIPFYDKEFINLSAKQTGFTPEYIAQHEQALASSLLDELYEQNYAYVNDEMPPIDTLFLVQSKIIRTIASKQSCVIVGRCANFVLKDNPNCFNIFIHANTQYRLNKINNEYKATPVYSDKELEASDKKRALYCIHYTYSEWRDVANYHVSIDSSKYGSEQSAKELLVLIRKFSQRLS